MDFDKVIESRKSVKSFKNKVASFKDALLAIDAALQAPYSGNLNNLKFIIVENKDKIKRVADLCQQDWINDVGILVVVCADDQQLESMYGERGRVYSKQQAGAAIENLILKLTDLGLGSCWVGAYSDELVKQLFNVPAHFQIEAIIPIGYEKKIHEPQKRKAQLVNIIYWENWFAQKRPTAFTEAPRRKDPWA